MKIQSAKSRLGNSTEKWQCFSNKQTSKKKEKKDGGKTSILRAITRHFKSNVLWKPYLNIEWIKLLNNYIYETIVN